MLLRQQLSRAGAITVTVLLALAAGAAAQAPIGSDVRGSGEIAGGIHVDGSDEANDLFVEYDAGANRFLVSDGAGVTGCHAIDSDTVSCEPSQPDSYIVEPGVSFIAYGGDDRALFDASILGTITGYGDAGKDRLRLELGGEARGRFLGGSGADVLQGGSAWDSVHGGTGSDRLDGRFGDDHVTGGPGTDRLRGGGGDDRLSASASGPDPDHSIRCGPGKDTAIIDRGDDPKPRGCERILGR